MADLLKLGDAFIGDGESTNIIHDNTLSGNGTVEAPLGVVSSVNPVSFTTLFETNDATGKSEVNLTESIKNFEYISITPSREYPSNPYGGFGLESLVNTTWVSANSTYGMQCVPLFMQEIVNGEIWQKGGLYQANTDYNKLTQIKGFEYKISNNGIGNFSQTTTGICGILKVVGINRK